MPMTLAALRANVADRLSITICALPEQLKMAVIRSRSQWLWFLILFLLGVP
jgi:hypothetical protein